MDNAQRWLIMNKLDIILDNRNNPVRVRQFANKLEADLQLRDQYLCNIEIWIIYFQKKLAQKNINSQLVENKLAELLQVGAFFTKEKWPKLYRSIEKMETLIKET